ncbi:NAD+ synthase [Halobacteriovorax vibrionivorans]|uniref:Glutamine-dependent NAD(+) synthetase n=1 Tax=Halobacteriovorax vibrionivorans TaxID=2152716 RepID=A0ABY0IEL9_9BACT|nr:NAD+ synthase [Halobacteriovorax vibrionivorans]RZF20945.1 NAD+ synthase [Halobacteriovorax vibrionivorans]
MQIVIHQTDHTIGNFTQIYKYIENLTRSEDFQDNIHIFPETFLSGYPLQDLVLQKTFIRQYHELLQALRDLFAKIKLSDKTALLVGGLRYEFKDNADIPSNIYNVIYEVTKKSNFNDIYTKCLLPDYDIFDESKYYTPGSAPCIWSHAGCDFGLLICEDMWHSEQYAVNPLQMLMDEANGKELNGIINFSASPWNIDKEEKRIKRASEISRVFKTPFYYVNKVGAEDEIIFDGASFVVNETQVIAKAKSFKSDLMKVEIAKKSKIENLGVAPVGANSWESLFGPHIEKINGKMSLKKLSDDKLDAILGALNLGLQDYARKCGMNKFLVALSGGIDSALVLTLVKLFLKPGQEVEAIYMPSKFSASLSWEISDKLCKNLGIKLHNLPIKFLHSSVQNLFNDNLDPLEGLADENIQSRLRGSLLFARSNQTGAMVINTSNKSELAVGYSTLYGDSVGAISLLGDLYKSEVFALARHINKNFSDIIPVEVIERPPSAELRADQKDEDSLPPYETLDMILESYLSYRYDLPDLLNLGLNKTEVERVIKLILNSEYKRQQFCPILKLKDKSFGFGRRVPICKKVDFNLG